MITYLLNINKNYAIVDGTEYFLTPKTKRSFREITVPESLHAELLEYIDGMGLHPTERIFYFGKGGLTTEFKRIIKKSGNEDIRIHDLRHSHTAMLVDMGIQIEKISRRLGHESIKTTWDTYSHLYLGKAKALAQKIEILINADTEKTSSAIIPNGAVVNMAEGSPLGKVSQYILSEAERSGNDHIRRNNRHIFAKYGIDIDSEMIYGYKMLSYLDLIAFGDAIIKTISTFAPSEILKDFIISMLSDAVSSCEMINSSLENLDRFLVDVTIPNYHKLYQLKI